MTSLYEISYYGIEQHITVTLPAWLCLFTVRNYMTLFNTLALHAIRWCSGMSLASHAEVPGSRRTQYSVVSVIFIAIIVLYFLLSFSRNEQKYIHFPFILIFSYKLLFSI